MEKEIDKKNLVLRKTRASVPYRSADDVVAMIASLAATEVDGVSAMAGNVTNELMSKVGVKSLTNKSQSRGADKNVTVDLTTDHGVRLQYSRYLSGSTAEGEKCH